MVSKEQAPVLRLMAMLGRSLALLCTLLIGASRMAFAAEETHALQLNTLQLNSQTRSVEAWPYITMLTDKTGQLSLSDITSQNAAFVKPNSAYATLGMRGAVVWLKMRVKLDANVPAMAGMRASTGVGTGAGGQLPMSLVEHARALGDVTDSLWVLDFGYALLNRVNVYVMRDQTVVMHEELGNTQPFTDKPMASRAHAMPLRLVPGNEYEIYARIDTIGAKILPITVSTFSTYHGREMGEQILQGALTSLAICLLLYSLLKWRGQRESLYLKYAFLVAASGIFSVHFFGIGEQYLWTDNDWIERHLAGCSALLASAATALFVEDILRADISRRMRHLFRIVALVLILAAFAHAIDLLSIRGVGYFMNTLGVLPSLLGVPGAISRMRRGDTVGVYFIIAWIGYFIASVIMVGMVLGKIDANFWTLHSFQFGATLDMLVFMRIAVLRSNAVHVAAERASRERDSLFSMAHSDPLTGMMNRRGLNEWLDEALKNLTAESMLTLYLLDLDSFKPVNDQYGHDTGDELLVLVAKRLRGTVRAGDVVARLGGDEFVVLASGLQSGRAAEELGYKLLEAIRAPYALSRQTCEVGATIGYALAPADGRTAVELLKAADASMYAGKQGGKNRVQRGVIQMEMPV
jgi:diguanylate cyclase